MKVLLFIVGLLIGCVIIVIGGFAAGSLLVNAVY